MDNQKVNANLSTDGTGHHVPHGRVGNPISGDTSSGHQQVVNIVWNQTSIRNLK